MNGWHKATIAFAATTLLAGCGTARVRDPHDPNFVSLEEITEVNVATAHDAVQRLRPQWLRIRGVRSLRGGGDGPSGPGATSVVVYVDGVRAGDLGALASIPAAAIESMRFLDASQATTEHGTGHLYGSIEIRTRHGGNHE